VSTDPADAAAGADVQNVAGISEDGSYIYFTANGKLAPGGQSGHESLYVWHDGTTSFIAPSEGFVRSFWTPAPPAQPVFAISPNGLHFAFVATSSLTGYDNTDPKTGQRHSEVFEGSFGGGLVCASCRADGSRPTGDATFSAYEGVPPGHRLRIVSEDGSRVFFNSTDAVVPQASGGKQQVFEYSEGKVAPISKPDGETPAKFLDASADGDDVFFVTFEELTKNPNGGDMVVYDARVNGGFNGPGDEPCQGSGCQGPPAPAPATTTIASLAFHSEGKAGATSARVSATRPKTIHGTKGRVKVKVPGEGRVTVSGHGIKTARSAPKKARAVTLPVKLTGKAAKRLRRHGIYKTKVKVSFVPSDGKSSSTNLSLTFKVASTGKGK
jgi:hypothetical protein